MIILAMALALVPRVLQKVNFIEKGNSYSTCNTDKRVYDNPAYNVVAINMITIVITTMGPVSCCQRPLDHRLPRLKGKVLITRWIHVLDNGGSGGNPERC